MSCILITTNAFGIGTNIQHEVLSEKDRGKCYTMHCPKDNRQEEVQKNKQLDVYNKKNQDDLLRFRIPQGIPRSRDDQRLMLVRKVLRDV